MLREQHGAPTEQGEDSPGRAAELGQRSKTRPGQVEKEGEFCCVHLPSKFKSKARAGEAPWFTAELFPGPAIDFNHFKSHFENFGGCLCFTSSVITCSFVTINSTPGFF